MKFGKCTPRKILTKKLNMPGWEIYRDSAYGMYALHNELGLDVNLMEWNITLNNPKLESILEYTRAELAKVEKQRRIAIHFDQRFTKKGDNSYVY